METSRLLLVSVFCDSRHSPYISHLLTVIQFFHQAIVKFVWNFLHFSCPDYKLCRISKETTRDISRRISLLPRYYIQNLISKFRKTICHRKDIVISATYPYCAIIFQLPFLSGFCSRHCLAVIPNIAMLRTSASSAYFIAACSRVTSFGIRFSLIASV